MWLLIAGKAKIMVFICLQTTLTYKVFPWFPSPSICVTKIVFPWKGGRAREERWNQIRALANLFTILLLWHKVDTPFLLSCLLLCFLNLPFFHSSFLHSQPPQSLKTLALSSGFLQEQKARGWWHLLWAPSVLYVVLPCWDACVLYPWSFHRVSEVQIPPETEQSGIHWHIASCHLHDVSDILHGVRWPEEWF